jgi:hypothetical protein
MCRNIKTLFNFDPPATVEEIRAASFQFVRKISGFQKPSKINQALFEQTVEEVTRVASNLLTGLSTEVTPRNRKIEAGKAKARATKRFATS